MPSNDENLDRIQQELHAALEDRISELLGHVRAAQVIATRLEEADSEISKQEEIRAALGGSGDHPSELAAVDERVARIQAVREELVSNLSVLTGELSPGGDAS